MFVVFAPVPFLFSSTNMALDATSVSLSETFLLLLMASFAAVRSQEQQQQQRQQPNILFILADDLGFNDVPWHNPKIIAPHLVAGALSDYPQIRYNFPTLFQASLASSGLILESAYVQPVCTPTRSALLTGYHPVHLGRQVSFLWPLELKGLYTNFTLLPEHLNRLGYRSHAVGK